MMWLNSHGRIHMVGQDISLVDAVLHHKLIVEVEKRRSERIERSEVGARIASR
jgi:hypothetical protein